MYIVGLISSVFCVGSQRLCRVSSACPCLLLALPSFSCFLLPFFSFFFSISFLNYNRSLLPLLSPSSRRLAWPEIPRDLVVCPTHQQNLTLGFDSFSIAKAALPALALYNMTLSASALDGAALPALAL
jgi:hypothetical protein